MKSNMTAKYPQIARALASLHARQAYLDGELCGVRVNGITSFSMIQLVLTPAMPSASCGNRRGVLQKLLIFL